MRTQSMFRLILQVVTSLFVAYALLLCILFLFQNYLLYFPNDDVFDECSSFEQVIVNDIRLHVDMRSSDILVLYHGNAGSACQREQFRNFTNRSIIILEYPGFGGDDTRPSEQRIKQAVWEVHRHVSSLNPRSVVVMGESIGSSFASYHATLGGVDRLILLSPFDRLSSVVRMHYPYVPLFLLREEHPVTDYLERFSGPVFVMHGSADTVVPARLSESLSSQRVLIRGAGHNDLFTFSQSREILREWLED